MYSNTWLPLTLLRSFFLLVGPFPLAAEMPEYQQGKAAEAEVQLAAERFVQSFNNLDWEEFGPCFAEDATIFFPSPKYSRRLNGREEIVTAFKTLFADIPKRRPGPPYLNIQPKELKIQMLNDAAILTFHLGGDGMVVRRTLVFQKKGNQWLIVHLHGSSMEPPK